MGGVLRRDGNFSSACCFACLLFNRAANLRREGRKVYFDFAFSCSTRVYGVQQRYLIKINYVALQMMEIKMNFQILPSDESSPHRVLFISLVLHGSSDLQIALRSRNLMNWFTICIARFIKLLCNEDSFKVEIRGRRWNQWAFFMNLLGYEKILAGMCSELVIAFFISSSGGSDYNTPINLVQLVRMTAVNSLFDTKKSTSSDKIDPRTQLNYLTRN